ncbi:hypothetical protein ACR8G1_22240, partial [Salmonella enterica subsp. enterica serovar Paratyphi A]
MKCFKDFFKIDQDKQTTLEAQRDESIKKFYKEYYDYFVKNCDDYNNYPNLIIILFFVDPYLYFVTKAGTKEVYGPRVFDGESLILYKNPETGKWLQIWDDKIFKDGKLVGNLEN